MWGRGGGHCLLSGLPGRKPCLTSWFNSCRFLSLPDLSFPLCKADNLSQMLVTVSKVKSVNTLGVGLGFLDHNRPWVPSPAPDKPGVEVYTCHPSTRESEARGFKDVQGYVVSPR